MNYPANQIISSILKDISKDLYRIQSEQFIPQLYVMLEDYDVELQEDGLYIPNLQSKTKMRNFLKRSTLTLVNNKIKLKANTDPEIFGEFVEDLELWMKYRKLI